MLYRVSVVNIMAITNLGVLAQEIHMQIQDLLIRMGISFRAEMSF